MKKNLLPLLFAFVFNTAWAQTTEDKITKASTPSPDFPGSLVFEYGLNYMLNNDIRMKTNPWQSPSINVYYMYPIQIGNSRFSVNPGLGVGSEKFSYEAPVTLFDSVKITVLKRIKDVPRFSNIGGLTKTQFIANYIDFPLEFRVHTRKNDHKRSWYLAFGGKIGVNFYAKTKIKYSEFGSDKIYKDKYHFNVNSFRYGLVARIGYGPFNMWYYYSGSEMFRGNKLVGENGNPVQNPNMWSFGMSIATF